MWRTRPLFGMLVRILLASIAIETARAVVLTAAVLGFGLGGRTLGEMAHDIAIKGGLSGLIVAVPMILVTAVCFREIRRPLFYRYAMVTVALIVIIETFLRPSASFIHYALFSLGSEHMLMAVIAVMFISQAALAYACAWAAGAYVREFKQGKLALKHSV